MKRIILATSVAVLSLIANADEISDAYQKEYAYLVAEKESVAQRLAILERQGNATAANLQADIDKLQAKYLANQNRIDQLNNQISDAERGVSTAEGDQQLLDTTLLQARESLQSVDSTLPEEGDKAVLLQQAFAGAVDAINADSRVSTRSSRYFSSGGNEVEADVLSVGRIANYGLADNAQGALYPSGNGMLSVWETEKPANLPTANNNGESHLDVFFYDNINKAIEKREDRGFNDDIEAGGLIGKVILILGLLGALMVLLRALFLWSFSSNVHKVSNKADRVLAENTRADAVSLFERGKGSVNRVIAKTVQNLDKSRDHLEDIISESILHERSRIDRFAAIILVIAAVSPLLGLLGTVTGMISTFDIITEFGTGDPKLLSSGISEALITTKFGLVVAIPLLILGNIMTAWGNRIKNDLEQAALHVINVHKA